MKDETIFLTVGGVVLVASHAIAFMCGLTVHSLQDRAAQAKQEAAQAAAYASAVTDAVDISDQLEKGLITDGQKVDTAVTDAKAGWHAVKKPVVEPAPQCGPSAYVIKVEGATPDDLWRAYSAGRNGVLFPQGDAGSETGISAPGVASDLSASEGGSIPAL